PCTTLFRSWAGRLSAEDRQRVCAAAEEAGVADAVQLLGYVPDAELAALYRGATAQVFVSRAEGFGYPVVEAMACGCPVITSNRSSMIEMAEDAALTVDPEDPDAIAGAIVLLADDNAERRRLAERGVHRAQHYSLRKMGERTLEAYRHVVGSRPWRIRRASTVSRWRGASPSSGRGWSGQRGTPGVIPRRCGSSPSPRRSRPRRSAPPTSSVSGTSGRTTCRSCWPRRRPSPTCRICGFT